MKKILFICTGNICRSPTAEAVARTRIREKGLEDQILVDSAGIQGYHIGEAPDPRTQKAARTKGYDMAALRASQLCPSDYETFDWLVAMDQSHVAYLQQHCPQAQRHKIKAFADYLTEHALAEIPDPYYGGPEGFANVLAYCEDGVETLLDSVLSADQPNAL